jgi:hypothetical protein
MLSTPSPFRFTQITISIKTLHFLWLQLCRVQLYVLIHSPAKSICQRMLFFYENTFHDVHNKVYLSMNAIFFLIYENTFLAMDSATVTLSAKINVIVDSPFFVPFSTMFPSIDTSPMTNTLVVIDIPTSRTHDSTPITLENMRESLPSSPNTGHHSSSVLLPSVTSHSNSSLHYKKLSI